MHMITNPNYIIPQNFLAHLRNCRIIYGIIPDMSKSPVTISLLLDCIGGSGRLQLSGIFRYIHEHALNWTTVVDPFNSSSIPAAGYIVDGKQTSSDDFRKLDPKNIKSMEVMKGDSAAKYLQDLKDQGKYTGDINPSGGVIIVTQKK